MCSQVALDGGFGLHTLLQFDAHKYLGTDLVLSMQTTDIGLVSFGLYTFASCSLRITGRPYTNLTLRQPTAMSLTQAGIRKDVYK